MSGNGIQDGSAGSPDRRTEPVGHGVATIIPTASAATSASPAPVGLPTSSCAGVARQVDPGPAHSTPAGPSEATTHALRPCRRRADTPASPSAPVVASSSCRLGLTIAAPAARAATRAGPEQSTMLRTSWARARATSAAYASAVRQDDGEPGRDLANHYRRDVDAGRG